MSNANWELKLKKIHLMRLKLFHPPTAYNKWALFSNWYYIYMHVLYIVHIL